MKIVSLSNQYSFYTYYRVSHPVGRGLSKRLREGPRSVTRSEEMERSDLGFFDYFVIFDAKQVLWGGKGRGVPVSSSAFPLLSPLLFWKTRKQ